MAMKGLRNIVQSVRAFGRGISGVPASPLPSKIPSIGLALGGGFARGIVHVGVLKVLEEENIPIGCVAGTSVGALIGAAYCSGVSPAELEEIAAHVRFRDLAVECCRGVAREWTHMDVERGNSQRCSKCKRIMPGTIDHCFPDLAPHLGVRN